MTNIDAEFEENPLFAWTKGIDTRDRRREPGLIQSASARMESDHEIWQVNVGVDFGGGYQAFCPGFGKSQKAQFDQFAADVCKTFQVFVLDDMVGKRCYALRCFPGWNHAIEGLEDFETGRRIAVTDWWRAHVGPCPDPLEMEAGRRRRSVERAMREVAEYEANLKELKSDYRAWTSDLGTGAKHEK